MLRTGGQVLTRGFTVGEPAGRFDHHVDVQRFPGQFFGVFDGQHFDRVAVDEDLIIFGVDRSRQRAMDRIVLEKIGERFGVREIVDRDDL